MSQNIFEHMVMEERTNALADIFATQFLESTFSEKYQLLDLLGTGTFASCWRCRHRQNNQEFAVKIIERTVNYDGEETLLRLCQDHPNIVKLIEVHQTDVYIFLVMELLSGGELLQRARCSEREAQRIMRQLASAVKFMHSYDIVHRDLKPENIVYAFDSKDAPVKIVDFGFAQLVHSRNKQAVQTSCFTLPYAAPEVITHKHYDKSCDMWSLGIILYYMLSGTHPFGNKTIDVLTRIRMRQIDFDDAVWIKISPMAKQVILSLLNPNPIKRLTAHALTNHPWLAGNMFESTILIQPDYAVASTSTTTFARANEGFQLHTTSKLAQDCKRKYPASDSKSSKELQPYFVNSFEMQSTDNTIGKVIVAPIPSSNLSSNSNKEKQESIPEIVKETEAQGECDVSYKQKKCKKQKRCNTPQTADNSNFSFSGPMTRLRKRKLQEMINFNDIEESKIVQNKISKKHK
jgi:serine/threonine protein kinase